MTPLQFREYLVQHLISEHLIDQPGAFLYSAGRTVVPGDLMVLGANPGGSETATIGMSLMRFEQEHNCYLDEEWAPGNRLFSAGQAPLQVGTRLLVEACGYQVRDVCAANVVFLRSGRYDRLKTPKAAEDACWPVIETLLAIVRPKAIICYGRKAQDVLRRRSSAFRDMASIPANHDNWVCEASDALLAGHPVRVIMTPHPGVYCVRERGVPAVINWVADQVRSAPVPE